MKIITEAQKEVGANNQHKGWVVGHFSSLFFLLLSQITPLELRLQQYILNGDYRETQQKNIYAQQPGKSFYESRQINPRETVSLLNNAEITQPLNMI